MNTIFFRSIALMIFLLILFSCRHRNRAAEKVRNFNDLFARVQMSGVFSDSKTFPDCMIIGDTAAVIHDYNRAPVTGKKDLKAFVLAHFVLPPAYESEYHYDSTLTVKQHIDSLWIVLTRVDTLRKGSLLPLPRPYVVPGGRFREVYYWDSFFTMLGLKASGREDLVRDMVENFAFMLEKYGFIPNGNRTYYLSRSQPPFFSLMVDLLASMEGDSVYTRYLPFLETEYHFWMDGKEKLDSTRQAFRRVVCLNDSLIMNRYWDDMPRPRPEAFREDSMLALRSGRDPEDLYRNIRATCESGWDFSSRWLADPKDLSTIITTRIMPVDLNCLLYHLEMTLARANRVNGDIRRAAGYDSLATVRKVNIRRFFLNKSTGYYYDYYLDSSKTSDRTTLGGVYPLFFHIARPEESGKIVKVIRDSLLYPYGLATTTVKTGQQWDKPNGWPPLQYMAVTGLTNYGFHHEAGLVRDRFTEHCLYYLKTRHKFVEKYNVVKGLAGKGGEYPTQDGFGWTNGVIMQFLTGKTAVRIPECEDIRQLSDKRKLTSLSP